MRRRWIAVGAAAAALALPAGAGAVSVSYIDQGNVWVSSLDGTQKKQLTTDGDWDEVVQSDNGRTVGVRRTPPFQNPRLATISVWEATGVKAFDGFLPAPNGWTVYAYPLSLDTTADGGGLAYGFSNSRLGGGFPAQFEFDRGTYFIGLGGPWLIDPLRIAGLEWPTFAGNRLVANSGDQVVVQRAAVAPGGTEVDPWLNPIPGFDLHRSDVSANGRIVALEMAQFGEGSERTVGFIDVTPINALGDTNIPPGACTLSASGIALNVSLSQDATRIAWEDAAGVWVGGAPDFLGTGAPDPVSGQPFCVLTAPPVLIAPGAKYPSIGAADVAAMLPPPPPPVDPGTTPPPPPPGGSTPPPAPGGTTPPAPGGSAPPAAPVPTRLAITPPAVRTVAALRRGLAVRVAAPARGRVALVATIRGRAIGLTGPAGRRPAVVAKGSATVAGPRVVSVRLRLTPLGRARAARLKGKVLTVRTTLGSRVLVRAVRVR